MTNRILAIEFCFLGLLMIGFSLLSHFYITNISPVYLILGNLGGIGCLLWGILTFRGYQKKWWLVLILAILTWMFLSLAVPAWIQTGQKASRFLQLGSTLMLVFTFGSLMNLLHGQGSNLMKDNTRK